MTTSHQSIALLFVALAAAVATTVHAQLLFEADPNWTEAEFSLPENIDRSKFRSFFVSAASNNQFFVDENSLSVGDDGVVRYVLVVQTQGGAENITYEGIRCATGERRIYAMGRPDGAWSPARRSAWEAIVDNNYNRPRAALAFDHFCDGPAPPRSRDEALRLLRRAPMLNVR